MTTTLDLIDTVIVIWCRSTAPQRFYGESRFSRVGKVGKGGRKERKRKEVDKIYFRWFLVFSRKGTVFLVTLSLVPVPVGLSFERTSINRKIVNKDHMAYWYLLTLQYTITLRIPSWPIFVWKPYSNYILYCRLANGTTRYRYYYK